MTIEKLLEKPNEVRKHNGNIKTDELNASKGAATEAYDKLLEAKNHFRLAAEAAGIDIKDEAIEQLLKAKDKVEVAGAQASQYVKQNPFATVGIAFVAGVVLSRLFK